jgi:hypothetical protein
MEVVRKRCRGQNPPLHRAKRVYCVSGHPWRSDPERDVFYLPFLVGDR